MTLVQLLPHTIEELEAMSPAQLAAHFAPLLKACRPDAQAIAERKKKDTLLSDETMGIGKVNGERKPKYKSSREKAEELIAQFKLKI